MATNETVLHDEQSTSEESKIRKSELYKQLEKKMEELECQFKNITLNRVVPKMCPKKENYIVIYSSIENEKTHMRVKRMQLANIEILDKISQQFRDNPEKQYKANTEKKFGWLRNSQKILQVQCANAVFTWVKFCEQYPHMCYGFNFLNNTRTKWTFLDETELREKYRRDMDSHKSKSDVKNKKQLELNKAFEALNLKDEDTAVARCLTRQVHDFSSSIKNYFENVRLNNVLEDMEPESTARCGSNT